MRSQKTNLSDYKAGCGHWRTAVPGCSAACAAHLKLNHCFLTQPAICNEEQQGHSDGWEAFTELDN